MPVKMQPTSRIIARLGLEPDGKVQKYFTKRCADYMDKYVPKDNGDSRTIVDIQSDSITYEMPYARYQYYGMREDGTHQVQNYTTPGTGTYWDRKMWTAEGQDGVKEVQAYINRGGK